MGSTIMFAFVTTPLLQFGQSAGLANRVSEYAVQFNKV